MLTLTYVKAACFIRMKKEVHVHVRYIYENMLESESHRPSDFQPFSKHTATNGGYSIVKTDNCDNEELWGIESVIQTFKMQSAFAYSFYINQIKISPFISLSVCFCRSVHERQKQTESEMKGLILIRMFLHMYASCYVKTFKFKRFLDLMTDNDTNREVYICTIMFLKKTPKIHLHRL